MNTFFLSAGYIYTGTSPTLITTILGSCVSVAIYDRVLHYGAMNHFLLSESGKKTPCALYGDAATHKLISNMFELGGKRKSLVAYIFGGAHMNNSKESSSISKSNIIKARSILDKYKITITHESTGGTKGRKIFFYTETGQYSVTAIQYINDIKDVINEKT